MPVSTRLTAASTYHGTPKVGLGLLVEGEQLVGGQRLDDAPRRQRVRQRRVHRPELPAGAATLRPIAAGQRRGRLRRAPACVPLRVVGEAPVGDLRQAAGGVDHLGRRRRVADGGLGLDDLGGERRRVVRRAGAASPATTGAGDRRWRRRQRWWSSTWRTVAVVARRGRRRRSVAAVGRGGPSPARRRRRRRDDGAPASDQGDGARPRTASGGAAARPVTSRGRALGRRYTGPVEGEDVELAVGVLAERRRGWRPSTPSSRVVDAARRRAGRGRGAGRRSSRRTRRRRCSAGMAGAAVHVAAGDRARPVVVVVGEDRRDRARGRRRRRRRARSPSIAGHPRLAPRPALVPPVGGQEVDLLDRRPGRRRRSTGRRWRGRS